MSLNGQWRGGWIEWHELMPPFGFCRPIDVFVHFEGKRATDMALSRYAARHLIANEVSCLLWPYARLLFLR